MNKTKIDWTDYSINPVKGICKNNCWYCYARRMYKRFGWNPEIRFSKKAFKGIEKIKEPSRIFICSTNDLFGYWIEDRWIEFILSITIVLPQHTFIFLTKFPGRYKRFDFPKNCWLGTTITGVENSKEIKDKYNSLEKIKDNIKFISFEPILELPCYLTKVDWIIIGGLTGGYKYERPDKTIKELIVIARKHNIPIFLKDNLKWHEKIQEFPLGLIK